MLACNFGAAPPATSTSSNLATGTASNTGASATATTAPTKAPTAVPTATPTTTPTVPPTAAASSAPGSTPAAECVPGTGQVVKLASELTYEDLLICPGVEVKIGMTVTINYIGTLKDGGAQFDNSYDRGQPYTFVLGSGPIKGWDQGIVGMKVGSKRRLIVPPSLGYGNQSRPGIPANSTLVYEIDLVSAK
jgi:peptidylprolyl isomerase